MGPWCRIAVLVLPVALAAPAAADAAVRPPRTGNWEGRGPHGTAISFRLVRHGHRIDVGASGLTLTSPTFQALCPAGPLTAVAEHFDRMGYTGPGAPPLPIFHYRPRDVAFDDNAAGSFFTLAGQLRNRRTMVLDLPYTGHQRSGCGWPKRLRFVAHPRPRAAVADGPWSGTVTGADGVTGTVSVTVADTGHVVDGFEIKVDCGQAGAGTGAGAPNAAEFIHADGSFAGPIGASIVNDVPQGWTGRFSGGTLTGTFKTWNVCTGSGPLDAAFSAAPQPQSPTS